MSDTVTVVVINYNGAHLLPACLESIVNQDYDKDLLQIVVADNSSIDDSVSVVAGFPEVQFLSTGGNLGIGVPTNHIAKNSDSKYIVLLNYDLKLYPDCISKAVAAFNAGDDLFSVDFLQYNWGADFIVHSGTKLGKTSIYKGVLPGIDFVQGLEYEDIIFSCAGAMMFDREKAHKLGGFDSEFFLEFEDVDLCIRAQMMGWKSHFCKHAKVNHKVMDSLDPANTKGGVKYLEEVVEKRQTALRYNLYRFVFKVCDPMTITLFTVRELFKFVHFMVTFKTELIKYQIVAVYRLIRSFKDTMYRRRWIKNSAKLSYKEVRNKYLVD